MSLSDTVNDDDLEVEDRLSDPASPSVEYQIIKASVQQQIREILGELDEKEALVLKLRFGLDDDRPRTLQEIGDAAEADPGEDPPDRAEGHAEARPVAQAPAPQRISELSEPTVCGKCQGTGWLLEDAGGPGWPSGAAASPTAGSSPLFDQANIPRRYQTCTLDNFEAHNDSHRDALKISRQFVKNYPGPGRRPPVHRPLRGGEDPPGRGHHPGAHPDQGRRLHLLRFPRPHPGDPEHLHARFGPVRIRRPRPRSSSPTSSSSTSWGPSGRRPGSRRRSSTSSTTATTRRS